MKLEGGNISTVSASSGQLASSVQLLFKRWALFI